MNNEWWNVASTTKRIHTININFSCSKFDGTKENEIEQSKRNLYTQSKFGSGVLFM